MVHDVVIVSSVVIAKWLISKLERKPITNGERIVLLPTEHKAIDDQ